MGFWSKVDRGLDRRSSVFEDATSMKILMEKANKVFRHRPRPEDFVDVGGYSKEEISKDVAYVEKVKKRFGRQEEKVKQMSELFEALVVERADRGWLGNIEAVPTSEFDDIVNGVDLVLRPLDTEEGVPPEYAGLSIDVTLSSDTSILKKKIERSWDDLKKNKLSQVKYHEDDLYQGRLDVPRYAIAIDHADLERLMRLWLGGERQRDNLDNDPFRYQIIIQIMFQLKKGLEYLRSNRQAPTELLERYEKSYEFVQSIAESSGYSDLAQDELDNILKSDSVRRVYKIVEQLR